MGKYIVFDWTRLCLFLVYHTTSTQQTTPTQFIVPTYKVPDNKDTFNFAKKWPQEDHQVVRVAEVENSRSSLAEVASTSPRTSDPSTQTETKSKRRIPMHHHLKKRRPRPKKSHPRRKMPTSQL